MLKINVLIITYNQEKVIGRAIESVLSQKEYGLNKIIICDDCSKDNNRSVLMAYQKRYPEIIENHFNETNLGIYGNCNKLVTVKGNADLFLFLSGDDALKPGWFERIQNFLSDKNIYTGENPFSIYSDWSAITVDGKETVMTNSLIAKFSGEALSLKIRGRISTRSSIHSKGTLNQFRPVDLNHGLSYAEELFDCQALRYSRVKYYVPYVASIYYRGVGISKYLGREYLMEDEVKWSRLINDFDLEGRDLKFAKCKQECARFYKTHQVKYFFRTINLYISSSKLKYGGTLKGLFILLKSMFADILRSKNHK